MIGVMSSLISCDDPDFVLPSIEGPVALPLNKHRRHHGRNSHTHNQHALQHDLLNLNDPHSPNTQYTASCLNTLAPSPTILSTAAQQLTRDGQQRHNAIDQDEFHRNGALYPSLSISSSSSSGEDDEIPAMLPPPQRFSTGGKTGGPRQYNPGKRVMPVPPAAKTSKPETFQSKRTVSRTTVDAVSESSQPTASARKRSREDLSFEQDAVPHTSAKSKRSKGSATRELQEQEEAAVLPSVALPVKRGRPRKHPLPSQKAENHEPVEGGANFERRKTSSKVAAVLDHRKSVRQATPPSGSPLDYEKYGDKSEDDNSHFPLEISMNLSQATGIDHGTPPRRPRQPVSMLSRDETDASFAHECIISSALPPTRFSGNAPSSGFRTPSQLALSDLPPPPTPSTTNAPAAYVDAKFDLRTRSHNIVLDVPGISELSNAAGADNMAYACQPFQLPHNRSTWPLWRYLSYLRRKFSQLPDVSGTGTRNANSNSHAIFLDEHNETLQKAYSGVGVNMIKVLSICDRSIDDQAIRDASPPTIIKDLVEVIIPVAIMVVQALFHAMELPGGNSPIGIYGAHRQWQKQDLQAAFLDTDETVPIEDTDAGGQSLTSGGHYMFTLRMAHITAQAIGWLEDLDKAASAVGLTAPERATSLVR
ncbi:hypothetical protein CFIMG_007476RA00001 [Ceratocystis fimbriata CBS 114723]|uniref:Uncharacterized protein n=1 Tax=Ceratocystis fimbriata CBS 114723 TaxID=1035309 RepID=A0A2C5XG93_9PEZI|nr:hypothetical protein CFIMG_007476RA00001 [Ceratocystis fimbriata CBS 114723]